MLYPAHHKAIEKEGKTPGEVFRKSKYLHEAIMHVWLKSCGSQHY